LVFSGDQPAPPQQSGAYGGAGLTQHPYGRIIASAEASGNHHQQSAALLPGNRRSVLAHLFSKLTLRGLTLRNRIVMSPMCMYCADQDGRLTDWHLSHYLTRAVGGAGLVLTEATAVEPRGRITRQDLGLWDDAQVAPFGSLVRLVHREGAAIGVQLAHAGRKAWSPEKGHGPETAVAPSAIPFEEGWAVPRELDRLEIDRVTSAWQAAAARALAADFDVIEIHGAHGYLAHQFLSPLSNMRDDDYGGTLKNRMRFLLLIVQGVRSVWPEQRPLFVRVSATDWVDGGLVAEDLVTVARELQATGVDLIDCSSGGAVPAAPPGIGPGYQVPFAEKIRREAHIATGAVGLIATAELAEEIVRNNQADLVLLGRELLRHPYWPLEAARTLGHEIPWPQQYLRARPA
jgi:2,4-dienoyl-CoA reductase-like NADH-dependent reductase (Old Yellow Enzyme family)